MAGRAMPEAVRLHLGCELQALYAVVLAEAPPTALLDLIARLEVNRPAAADFRAGLLDALPGLRAFALSLAIAPNAADDLVQETLLKAWANRDRFEPGSNLMAWLCTILRNQFYTECRKRRREVEDADGAAAAQLIVLPSQEHGIELQKVWAILATMPATQREALLLVAGQGLTYEAAAALVGSQTGTMKSRVSRARAFLVDSLGLKSSQAAI